MPEWGLHVAILLSATLVTMAIEAAGKRIAERIDNLSRIMDQIRAELNDIKARIRRDDL